MLRFAHLKKKEAMEKHEFVRHQYNKNRIYTRFNEAKQLINPLIQVTKHLNYKNAE